MAEERGKRMSILIRGMEMPKNCKGCRFKGPKPYWDDDGDRHIGDACMLCGELVDAKIRSSVCPLIEVPKHGRLIEDTALDNMSMWNTNREYDRGWDSAVQAAKNRIKTAPTIIEAEGEDG